MKKARRAGLFLLVIQVSAGARVTPELRSCQAQFRGLWLRWLRCKLSGCALVLRKVVWESVSHRFCCLWFGQCQALLVRTRLFSLGALLRKHRTSPEGDLHPQNLFLRAHRGTGPLHRRRAAAGPRRAAPNSNRYVRRNSAARPARLLSWRRRAAICFAPCNMVVASGGFTG